jgi:hypothetical protein
MRRGLGVLCALAGLSLGAAAAGPAIADAGVTVQTEAQPPWRSFLVRRGSGSLDARFGVDGRVLVDRISPRGVAADDRGRYVVAGRTRGGEPRPALQRFLSNGAIDPSWGVQGTTIDAPVAAPSTAIAAMPLGDGRTLVIGEVERLNPQAALWIVGTDGRFEPRWLLLSEAPSSRVLSLVRVSADTAMIGVQAGRPSGVVLEAHVFTVARDGDGVPEVIARQPVPKNWGGAVPLLERRDNGWFWVDSDQPKRPSVRAVGVDESDGPLWAWQRGAQPMAQQALSVAPAPAAPETRDPGGAAFNPFVERRGADAPPPASEPGGSELAIWGLVLLVGGYGTFRLVRRGAA